MDQDPLEDAPARAVAVAWGVHAHPQRGPKRELSHERIVEVAIAIADTEGLGAVTMQRVAAAFGFTTMALYRYVATKDELHELMADTALAPPAGFVVDPADWEDGVRVVAHAILALYLEHPWVMDLPLRADARVMPGQLAWADHLLCALRSLPTSDDARLMYVATLSILVRGFAAMLIEMGQGGIDHATRALVLEVVTPDRFPDASRVVHSGIYFGGDVGTPESVPGIEDVVLGLSTFIEGMRAETAGGDAAVAEPASSDDPAVRLAIAERALADAKARTRALQRRAKDAEKAEADAHKAVVDAKQAARLAAKAAR